MGEYIPNSVQITTAFIDDLMPELSGVALKCYLFIVRKTVGWQKESDSISMSQFIEGTKIKDRRTIQLAIDELISHNLIEVSRNLGKVNHFALVARATHKNCEYPQKLSVGTKNVEGVPTKIVGGVGAKNVGTYKKCTYKNCTPTNIYNINSSNNRKNIYNGEFSKNENSAVANATHAPTSETIKEKNRSAKPTTKELLAKYGIEGVLADDFIAHRKLKITPTALDGFRREAEKASISTADAVRIAIERGWQGFKADWNWQSNPQPQAKQSSSTPVKHTGFTKEYYGDEAGVF